MKYMRRAIALLPVYALVVLGVLACTYAEPLVQFADGQVVKPIWPQCTAVGCFVGAIFTGLCAMAFFD